MPEKFGQTQQKTNLICRSYLKVTAFQVNTCMSKDGPDNEFWTKGNNFCKIKSSMIKVELNL